MTRNLVIRGNKSTNIKNICAQHNVEEKDYTIIEIVTGINKKKDSLLKQIDEECSNKRLEYISGFISSKKKFTGVKKYEERKGFVIDYIIKLHDEINEEAKFFYRVEEDRTNKIHLRKRRKIVTNVNYIEHISAFAHTNSIINKKKSKIKDI